MTKHTLPVIEIFGPTFQGEGPYAGRRSMFLRLAGCNLACNWCDTPYSWDATRFPLQEMVQHLSMEDVSDRLQQSAGVIIITGGEPLLHARSAAFKELLKKLKTQRRSIHLESNGTIFPPPDVLEAFDVIVLSPKLPSANASRHGRSAALHQDWRIAALKQEIHLKVVCSTAEEVAQAAELGRRHEWPLERVWVMPEAADREELTRRWRVISEASIEFGVNVTSRLHIAAWGNVPGR